VERDNIASGPSQVLEAYFSISDRPGVVSSLLSFLDFVPSCPGGIPHRAFLLEWIGNCQSPTREKCPVHHQGGDEPDCLDALQPSAEDTQNRAGSQIETKVLNRYAIWRTSASTCGKIPGAIAVEAWATEDGDKRGRQSR